MQNVGNTYQGMDAIFAVNGRDTAANSTSSEDSTKGLDFSKMLDAIKNNSTIVSQLKISNNLQGNLLGKDLMSFQKAESQVATKQVQKDLDEESEDDKSKVKKHKSYHENKLLGKDNSNDATDVISAMLVAHTDKAKTASIEGETNMQINETTLTNDLQALTDNADEITNLNTVVAVENSANKASVIDASKLVASDNNAKNLKNLEQNIAFVKDDLNLSNEDAKALFDLISNTDDLDLSSLTKEKLEATVDKFYKGQLSMNEMMSSLKTSDSDAADQDLLSSADEELLQKLLKDTNAQKITISDPTKAQLQNKDFGASFFGLLEEQFAMQQQADEALNAADVQSKITKLMDAKDSANQSTLENSLALLRQASAGMSELNTANSKRSQIYESSELSTSLENLQNSLKNISATSSDANASDMNNGQSFDNRSLSQVNVIHDLMSKTGNVSSKELFTQELNKNFNMLNMSRNLKENAQALTEKVMMMSSRNLKNVVFDLNPEGLGKMKISLDLTNADDIAKISISASNISTKALIESGLETLKDTLRQNNISADAKVVDYDDGNNSHNGNNAFAGNGNGSNSQEQQEKRPDTIFASNESEDGELENEQLNDLENIINSQNDDTISYFA